MKVNKLIEELRAAGIQDKTVLDAIAQTPRHQFLSSAQRSSAYENIALPIGYDQTISQPYIVARMTESVFRPSRAQRVLEIGTGSGYQAAVLSQLFEEVYTIDRIKPLIEQAQKRFDVLKINNIKSLHGDGYLGWQAHAPYDAILVTAAVPDVPRMLTEQLADGARLIAPIKNEYDGQTLHLITRQQDGYQIRTLDPVLFVPLIPGKED